MDSERFDAVVRMLHAGTSRRGVLGALAGVTAAVVARDGHEAEADTCKRNGKPCKKDRQCCSDNCLGASGNSTAKSGGTCQPKYFQGTCEVGENVCLEERIDNCNPDPLGPFCACHKTAADGATVCAQGGLTCEILDCERDLDCASLGEGYVCIDPSPFCIGCPGGRTNNNFCIQQCNV